MEARIILREIDDKNTWARSWHFSIQFSLASRMLRVYLDRALWMCVTYLILVHLLFETRIGCTQQLIEGNAVSHIQSPFFNTDHTTTLMIRSQ